MHRKEVVHIGKSCLNPPCQRLVFRRPQERVEPNEPRATPLKPLHLRREHFGLTAVPPIADDEHDRTSAQDTPRPIVVEPLQTITDTRPPGPVCHGPRHSRKRAFDIPITKVTTHPCQPRTKGEGLYALTQALREAIDEVKEETSVAFPSNR